MPSEAEQIKKFEEFKREFALIDKPPHHLVPRAGDRILIDRERVRLVTNRDLSNESVEVVDVVEK